MRKMKFFKILNNIFKNITLIIANKQFQKIKSLIYFVSTQQTSQPQSYY